MKRFSTTLAAVLVTVVALAAVGCDDPVTAPGDVDAPGGTIYINGGTRTEIHSIDMASGLATNLFKGSDPYRTPEGTFIVRTHEGLAEVSADGATSRMIVPSNEQAPFDVTYDDDFRSPQLSPDGRYIAYEGQFGYRYDFYIVDRQTGELLLEYFDPEIGAGMTRPTWTPDGRIVVAGTQKNPGLFISDASWENYTRFDPNLNNPTQPCVSPDGSQVAFVMNDHIYTINIDGTNLQQVTTSDWEESWPTWSPDGRWIASYGNNSILCYPLDGGEYYDIRWLNSTVDNHMTFNASRNGQFQWR